MIHIFIFFKQNNITHLYFSTKIYPGIVIKHLFWDIDMDLNTKICKII